MPKHEEKKRVLKPFVAQYQGKSQVSAEKQAKPKSKGEGPVAVRKVVQRVVERVARI
ncbi:MAG: hypothetical protein O3B43_02825 [Chloroflexi bacterium]|nr:hypothetical protein [Chloroflexota bacterium]